MSLVSTSMDVKRSQAHKICFMNTCWPNKRPRDPCIFLSQLASAASQHTTFHEIWPRGTSRPCVSPPRGKITWATYTKGLFLLEGLYNFNIPVAFFSETNSENPWDRSTCSKASETHPHRRVLFFYHPTSVELPNMVLGTEQSSSDKTICPWEPDKLVGEK